MAQAVIFDMDGVIVDTEPQHNKFVRDFVAKRGGGEPKNLSRFYGQTTRELWSALKEEVGLKEDIDTLAEESRTGFIEYLRSLPQLPTIKGVTELIEDISRAKLALAIATAANARRLALILVRTGLQDMFTVQVSGDDGARGKPEPDMFLLAARRLSIKPEECVVIEDSRNGVLAAKNAGMKTIGYAGSTENRDDLSSADRIVTDFSELNGEQLKSM